LRRIRWSGLACKHSTAALSAAVVDANRDCRSCFLHAALWHCEKQWQACKATAGIRKKESNTRIYILYKDDDDAMITTKD